jgi:hypothetical protein
LRHKWYKLFLLCRYISLNRRISSDGSRLKMESAHPNQHTITSTIYKNIPFLSKVQEAFPPRHFVF